MSISTGPQRRGTDRATTPGRCPNLDYCSIGMQRLQVRVPISQPFICPECASPLRPPSRMARAETRALLLPVNVWILVVSVALAAAAGFLAGRSARPTPRLPPAPAHQAAAAPPRENPARPPPPIPPAGFGAATLSPPLIIPERPYPGRAPALEQIDPSHHLPAEIRSGQVAIDCLLGSAMFRPACHVSSVRGTDAFSDAALVWLQKLPVRYATGPQGATPVALDHRWRVVFEDFSASPPTTAPANGHVSTKKR